MCVCAREGVEGGVLRRGGEAVSGGEKILATSAHPLFARTKIRVDYYLTPPCGFSIYFRRSSERLHGVCSDWARDFSPCDERRGMSLRFEVISLFLEWSCLVDLLPKLLRASQLVSRLRRRRRATRFYFPRRVILRWRDPSINGERNLREDEYSRVSAILDEREV